MIDAPTSACLGWLAAVILHPSAGVAIVGALVVLFAVAMHDIRDGLR